MSVKEQDIGKKLEGLLGKGQESDIIKVLNDLQNLDKDLEAKTDLETKDITTLRKLFFWCSEMYEYSPQLANETKDFGILYMKLRISHKRKSRTEIIKAIASQLTDMGKDKFIDKLLR
jgi:hypothetical protein